MTMVNAKKRFSSYWFLHRLQVFRLPPNLFISLLIYRSSDYSSYVIIRPLRPGSGRCFELLFRFSQNQAHQWIFWAGWRRLYMWQLLSYFRGSKLELASWTTMLHKVITAIALNNLRTSGEIVLLTNSNNLSIDYEAHWVKLNAESNFFEMFS